MLKIYHFSLSLVLSLVCWSGSAFAVNGYWEYQQFLDKYPVQKALTEQLSHTVRRHPVALNMKQVNPINISVVVPANQTSDYWVRNIKAFELRLNELGIRYHMNQVLTKPNQDSREQSASLLAALNDHVDYLIFTLDTVRHRKFIEHALGSTKTKLILQNITTPLKKWGNRQPMMYLGFDHEIGAKKIADYFKSTMAGRRNYSMLYYSPGYISQSRGDTFSNELNKDENFNLISSFYTDASEQSGFDITYANVKNNPNIDFIYVCSTDVALGAAAALKQLNRTDIMLNGWGGGSAELEAIKNGVLDVTVMRMNDDTGIAMAEAIKQDLQGEPVPLVYSGDMVVISKYDSIDTIERLERYAFRYSDQ